MINCGLHENFICSSITIMTDHNEQIFPIAQFVTHFALLRGAAAVSYD